MNSTSEISIRQAHREGDFLHAKSLILDYLSWLEFDLAFQNIDNEMATLAEMYSVQAGGGLLIAYVDGKAAGVVGIRRFENDNCELKRMFVSEEFRNIGLGNKLLVAAIGLAKNRGYKKIMLDTTDVMTGAIRLYRAHGFVEIAAYRFNPHPAALYFELALTHG